MPVIILPFLVLVPRAVRWAYRYCLGLSLSKLVTGYPSREHKWQHRKLCHGSKHCMHRLHICRGSETTQMLMLHVQTWLLQLEVRKTR